VVMVMIVMMILEGDFLILKLYHDRLIYHDWSGLEGSLILLRWWRPIAMMLISRTTWWWGCALYLRTRCLWSLSSLVEYLIHAFEETWWGIFGLSVWLLII
jgi:hypothetical protein